MHDTGLIELEHLTRQWMEQRRTDAVTPTLRPPRRLRHHAARGLRRLAKTLEH